MNRVKFLTFIVIQFSSCFILFGQDTSNSLAFKQNRPQKKGYQFYQPDLSYRIWQQYNLIKEANAGNPQAQHELGLRYLLGQDMQTDTLKGAFWLKKAADQNYTPALYNYGILLFNGWGVKWDPYTAFDLFKKAAKENMPQAQLLLGLLYSDGLVTAKDIKEAYLWVKKSSDNGYSPAVEYLNKLNKRVPAEIKDSSIIKKSEDIKEKNNPTVSSGLVYIDFDAATDSSMEIKYEDLLSDILNSPSRDLSLTIKKDSDSLNYFDSKQINILKEAADYGSPEALCLIGWFYENGKVLDKNVISAINFYVRGAELDSRKSFILLWQLINKKGVLEYLKSASDFGNSEASAAWYGLYKLKLDRRFTEADAINLLDKAAQQNNSSALVEEGLNYISGSFVKQDVIKGLLYWKKASELGDIEAKIRLETYQLIEMKNYQNKNEALNFLITASNKGSVLAEAALANFYYNANDITKAVYYFRSAAMRGSNYAYQKLKDLYLQFKP